MALCLSGEFFGCLPAQAGGSRSGRAMITHVKPLVRRNLFASEEEAISGAPPMLKAISRDLSDHSIRADMIRTDA